MDNISSTVGYSPLLPTTDYVQTSADPNCTNASMDMETVITVDMNGPLSYNIPINGYISPLVIIFTLVTNSLVCVILLKPNMRSPTNMILVFMAVSDTLTGLSPIPWYLYAFTAGNYKDYVPFEWCSVQSLLNRALPTVFHTMSIWLTLALAIQRYIYVCHFLLAKKLCTMKNVVKGSGGIFIVSVAVHILMFIDQLFKPIEVPSLINPNVTVKACFMGTPEFLNPIAMPLYNTYYWFRVLFIHLIPCIMLVVINALLIRTMQKAKKRRTQLLKQNRKSEVRKLKDANCTTMMMVAVVGVFLVVELPSGILFAVFIINTTFSLGILERDVEKKVSTIFNLLILISYPINFFIYAGMSRQFRETFKRLFCKGPLPLDREHSQYSALANENGRIVNTCTTAI
ncbi:sex peptide receptor-like [Lineus longissimus]|uniref:sex peptide receptor-like n=1 Tax=Lineus longissimus TaxID=88925 RepID=UPI00315D4D67